MIKRTASPFIKNVITLVSGTALAQIITASAYPISARLYTPEDFGTLELITATFSILASIACLKYEQGITLPKNDSEGYLVFKVSVIINLIFSTFLLVLVSLFSNIFASWLGKPSIQPYLFVIPFLVFFTSFFFSIRYYAIRQKEFKVIAQISVIKAFWGSGVQIILGLFQLNIIGLIISQICSSSLANFSAYKKLISPDLTPLWSPQKNKYQYILKKYIDFPKYSVPATLANSLVLYGSGIFVYKYFSADILGQFAVANRLLSMPLILVGNAVSDVFIQKASEEKNNLGNVKESFIAILTPLVILSVFGSFIGYFVMPTMFPYLLGDSWAQAGQYASMLIILFSIRFCSTPFSSLFIIFDKQNWNLVATISQLFLTIITMSITVRYDLSFLNYLKLHIVSQSVFYIIYLLFLWRIAKSGNK